MSLLVGVVQELRMNCPFLTERLCMPYPRIIAVKATLPAAKGLIKYLFDNSSTDVLNAIALKHNIPSNRVIQKCGFELLDEITIEHEDYNYYRLSQQQ